MAKKIAIASDHAGFQLKETLIAHFSKRIEFRDFGPLNTSSVDYPDFASLVSKAVQGGKYERGILLCGSGIGMAIAANKHHGVRAAVVGDEEAAKLSRAHNNTNIICIPARKLSEEQAIAVLELWLQTSFEAGRHARRVEKISNIENAEGGLTRL